MEPAQIRALDKGTALLLATDIPVALIELLPWYEGASARLTADAATATASITIQARSRHDA